jgi:hypothetical protein
MGPVFQVKKYCSWAHKIYCQFAQFANEKLKIVVKCITIPLNGLGSTFVGLKRISAIESNWHSQFFAELHPCVQ